MSKYILIKNLKETVQKNSNFYNHTFPNTARFLKHCCESLLKHCFSKLSQQCKFNEMVLQNGSILLTVWHQLDV